MVAFEELFPNPQSLLEYEGAVQRLRLNHLWIPPGSMDPKDEAHDRSHTSSGLARTSESWFMCCTSRREGTDRVREQWSSEFAIAVRGHGFAGAD